MDPITYGVKLMYMHESYAQSIYLIWTSHSILGKMTKYWLDESFNAGVLFPLKYPVFRNDRNAHGGGVALGIRCYLKSCFEARVFSF